MSETLKDRQNSLIQKFNQHPAWDDRYKLIIEMGRALPEMPLELKNEKNIVKGCQSQVWLHAELQTDGHVHFQGDSDALIVKGLVALLLNVYSDATPEEILKTPATFLKELGFDSNLSPSRANGLHAMLKQIQIYAMAFQYLAKAKL